MHSPKIFQPASTRLPKMELVFVIVGAGLSGMTVFCQLVEKLQAEKTSYTYRIKIIEKYPHLFATGEAYNIHAPESWTLNNPASKMKLTPNGKNADTWMKEDIEKWKEKFPGMDMEYVPRALIGYYLKDQYTLYKIQAEAHGILVEEHYDAVMDISATEANAWKIETEKSNVYTANNVFLCFGHAPSHQYMHLRESKNYFTSTSLPQEFKNIPNDEDVYIIGGQASYVDIVRSLVDQGHAGKIHSITRSKSMITCKGNPDQCNEKPLNELKEQLSGEHKTESLASIKQLLFETYCKSVKNPINFAQPPSTKEVLRYQISKYDHQAPENLMIGNIDESRSFFLNFYMQGCYQKLWELLSDEDKQEFNAQLYTLIMAYVTGITPINARLLLELYQRDMIVEYSGCSSIIYDEEKQIFLIQFTDKNPIQANYIINASGYGYDVSKANSQTPLIKKLIENGLLVPKKLGGIEITHCGNLIGRNKEILTGLFCIGPIASYNHKYPTPYALFIADEAAKNAVAAINLAPTQVLRTDIGKPLHSLRL